jgi:hypothetical protein
MDREQRQRLREIRRRRGHNVNEAPEVREAWQRCRGLSLAYLDAVIEAHASGGPDAVPGWGKYAHLSPPEQIARQEVDYQDWVRHMEDTPWFPGRTLGHAGLEALEAEIFAAWSEYAFHARIQGETSNCAGFDVERACLFKAGATAVGFDDEDELAQLTDGGMDLSGRTVEVAIPPEALHVLGSDWALRHGTPKIALQTRLIPDWEYPGYWLLKDNRDVSPAALAALLAGHPAVSERQLAALRGSSEIAAERGPISWAPAQDIP